VRDGITGLLATPRDEASFTDTIERLARDESLRKEMRTNSLARVRETFTIGKTAQETIRIYEALWS
jgi:glycosyltransferase involved in cell wall biosynthesis